MLKKLFEFRPVSSLVPNTGIQFLDFGLDESRVARLTCQFWPQQEAGKGDGGQQPAKVILHPLTAASDGSLRYVDELNPLGRAVPEEASYTFRAVRALEAFEGQWLPLPFLREKERNARGVSLYDAGPTNWARVQVRRLDTPDAEGNTHRVVLALDTLLLQRSQGAPYAAPEPADAVDDMRFAMVADGVANRWFLALEWVREWLTEAYLDGLSTKRSRRMNLEDLNQPGEYWAAYLTLLAALTEGLQLPQLRFVDTITTTLGTEPINVDLVIDVGNSRTCGILIEEPIGAGGVDISQAYRLELRDLSRPEMVYADPFASRIEFSPASFGRPELSRRAGRRGDAFWWPSPVRVGPEAAWLASLADGTEGVSGLSSAKRYLWDNLVRPVPWSNNRGTLAKTRRVPPISGPMTARLTEAGELATFDKPVGMHPLYSRSSLYTLMIAELLIQAMGQINAVATREQRAHADLPRRLRSLILTLPSATPIAEQRALKHRVANALELVWQTMGWMPDDPGHLKPKLKLDWDEATATHLVWLYNEIAYKFRGNAYDLIGLIGRERPNGRAVRIASMDMGGGTTDLMIIDHKIEAGDEQTIRPHQLFREGFRQAGDDIVQVIIEDVILPSLAQALTAAGATRPELVVAERFGGNRVGQTQQEQTLRALVANQVLAPAALGLIAACEETDPRHPEPPRHIRLGELLAGHTISTSVRAYLAKAAQEAGAKTFELDAVELVIDPEAVAGAVRSVTLDMLEDLCDIVRAYDCDLLLLTGRPSRLPAVRDIVLANLPLTPDRIISMDRYEVGSWYPFRSPDGLIRDPKTTAVVGALLCQVCEGMTRGLVFKATALKMRSTARYLGVMDLNGRIVERNMLLRNADLDTGANVVNFKLKMSGPVLIGFRQLPIERWKTTPLYYVHLANPATLSQLHTPLTLTFERRDARNEDDEVAIEDFKLQEVLDADGIARRNEIKVRLQTMSMDQEGSGGYWLDTGIFSI